MSGVISAFATVGTLAVAILVVIEARRIRRTEGIFRQNQAWNDFSNAVAQFHSESRIEALLTGKTADSKTVKFLSEDDLTIVEAFLLMSFFNVVSSEYHAVRVNAIDEKYVMHSFVLTHDVLRRNRAWIFRFLKKSGYEASFVRCLRTVERIGPDVQLLTPAIKAELRSCLDDGDEDAI